MRVLIGVDGSNCSLAAVRFVAQLLSPRRDTILLYYSPPTPSLPVHRGIDEQDLLERVQSALVARIFERSIAELPPELRESVKTVAGTKNAGHGLLIAADEYRANMIVVGSHGTNMWERIAIGSVSRTVAHSANVPVLIVREQPAPAKHQFRVLYACDQLETCDSAKEFLRHIHWPEGMSGQVISVLESFSGQMPEWLAEELRANDANALGMRKFESRAKDREAVQRDLGLWCENLPTEFRQLTPRLVEGPASQRILDALKAERFDLVVLRARRTGIVARKFLGSTSDYIANHSPCAVLIVR